MVVQYLIIIRKLERFTHSKRWETQFYIVGLIQDTSAGQVTAEKYLNTKK